MSGLHLNDGTQLVLTPGGNLRITARDRSEIEIQRADLEEVREWLWPSTSNLLRMVDELRRRNERVRA